MELGRLVAMTGYATLVVVISICTSAALAITNLRDGRAFNTSSFCSQGCLRKEVLELAMCCLQPCYDNTTGGHVRAPIFRQLL